MYNDLVKQCRDCVEALCGECKYKHLQKPGNFVRCMNALLGEAADAIEELSVVMRTQKAVLDKFPRWIPVTERLPESGEYVLCFCRANIVCVLRRDKDGDWYENPTHVYMSGFVTHWMPLPEPPEKEKA